MLWPFGTSLKEGYLLFHFRRCPAKEVLLNYYYVAAHHDRLNCYYKFVSSRIILHCLFKSVCADQYRNRQSWTASTDVHTMKRRRAWLNLAISQSCQPKFAYTYGNHCLKPPRGTYPFYAAAVISTPRSHTTSTIALSTQFSYGLYTTNKNG